VSNKEGKVSKWEAYAERLYNAGMSVLAEADKITVGAGAPALSMTY
jgi:hypothetical protein